MLKQQKKSSLMTLGTMGRNQNKCFLHCLKKPQRPHVHLVPVSSKKGKMDLFVLARLLDQGGKGG